MNTDTTSTKNHRARWAAIGAAVAVSLGAGGFGIVQATNPDGASAYVGTEPCRLLDTRPEAAFHIGPFGTLVPNGKITIQAQGDVGECTGTTALPDNATGLQLNVTPIGATQATNLRIYPGDGNPPNASNLNPAPGQRPIPNAVTVQLDGDGMFSIYNQNGNVDIAVDVVGNYTDHNHDDRYPLNDNVYTKAEIDALLAASGQGVEWINVSSNGTIRSTSPGLVGATVERPAGEPVGHYCIHVPSGHGLTSESAVGSVQNTAGSSDRTAVVTATFGNQCNSTGGWFVAVETFRTEPSTDDTTKVDSSFMIFIPRN